MRPCLLIDLGQMEYDQAWALQKALARRRAEGEVPDVLLLVEHPHTYTIGRRGDPSHILLPPEALRDLGVAVYEVDRGGQVTYHGPGQLVGYPILDLRGWMGPVTYIRHLEKALIEAVSSFGLSARRAEGLTGVWIGGRKIASIGVRITRGVALHGFALNINTDLSFFRHIVPCGLEGVEVTSLSQELGREVPVGEVAPLVAGALARSLDLALLPFSREEMLERVKPPLLAHGP